MKIFLDANILVSILNKEYPLFTYTARILSLADKPQYKLYCSPLSIAIAAYFSEKKSGQKATKNKISLLIKHISITSMDASVIRRSLESKSVNDIEDGMQYYSALDKGCDVIITEDTEDYCFSEIEVLTARRFFDVYLFD
jgi:predicted nucleic acid-binding protein